MEMSMKPKAVIANTDNGMVVQYDWTAAGVDRPITYGIGINGNSRKLADRLVRAIEDGAAYADAEIKTDNFGQTYVGMRSLVMARCLNADLTRLGY